jgi:hypothetical protein
MPSRHFIWYDGNSHVVLLDGLLDEVEVFKGNPGFINTATVTIDKIFSSATPPVNVLTSPVTATYVTGSNGDYFASLPSTTPVLLGQRYEMHVKVVAGGAVSLWKLAVTVHERR